jgi:hypothetical protein
MKVTRTQHTDATGIYLAHDSHGWTHCQLTERDGRTPTIHRVGPHYASKAAAYADHEAYLRRAGWMTDDTPAPTQVDDSLTTFKGLRIRPDGEANFYGLLDSDEWVAVVHLNGAFMPARQEAIMRRILDALKADA